jgi:integrase
MVIERGLSLGYRKTAEGGVWIVKRNIVMPPDLDHVKSWRHRPERPMGRADDYRDADGEEVLDFRQAQRKALEQANQDSLRASGQLDTVADAASRYVEFLLAHRKSAADGKVKLHAYVIGSPLGHKRVSELKEADLDGWLAWALKRRKKRKGRHEETPAGNETALHKQEIEERQRRRKATINRVINSLKACLRRAGAPEKVIQHLQRFRSVDSARLRWLTVEEARRLQNACTSDLRLLVRSALLTGCRAGELLALRARDFDPHSKTVLIADSKSGKPRHVPLTDEGVALFDTMVAGKIGDERVFFRADGSGWYRMAVVRAMREACQRGKINPPATFHTLRHTYASHLVQAGTPLLFVASALGHSDTRMVEKHYGHLAPSHIADTIRANLPYFGDHPKSKVRAIRR